MQRFPSTATLGAKLASAGGQMLVASIATAITLWIWDLVGNESGPLLLPALGLGILVVLKWPDIVTYRLGIDLVEGTRAYAGSGALSNPNDVALILLLPLSLASVAAFSPGSTIHRLGALFAGLVIAWGILVCQSRGAIFGMASLCAAIAYHRVKSKPMFLLIALLVLAAVGPALEFLERDAEGAQSFDDESAQGRIFAWNAGIAMAKAYPLKGVGIANFTAQYLNFTEAVTGPALTAHSIWFLILGEAGWPGLAVLIALVSVCLRDCKRAITAFGKIGSPTGVMLATGAFAGMISFLVSGSFVSYVYQWPLQVLFILTFTVSRATFAGRVKRGLPDQARLAPT